MKEKMFTILILCFILSGNIFAQRDDLVLSFEAVNESTNAPVPLESVFVENLSQSCDTTIYGEKPYLYLLWTNAIDEFELFSQEGIMLEQNFPNPFNERTKFNLLLKENGNVQIVLYDVYGQVVSSLENKFIRGRHTFEIRTGNTGIYLLRTTSNSVTKSIKLISISEGNLQNKINHVTSDDLPDFKQGTVNGNFKFQPGDELKMEATAIGYYNKTIFRNPSVTTSYTFELHPENVITLPSVNTLAITNITQNSATCGGDVTDDGGATVTARGVCWSTSQNPTITNNHTNDGGGTGSFSSYITGLSENTTFYVRAFATNSSGTAYGNGISFTSGQNITTPVVLTDSVTNITQNSATCGGNVTTDGGSTVTARGVCWSTAPNPTIIDYHTSDGSGTGFFTSDIIDLSENTTYYVRAYATNSFDTGYGNEISFSTNQTSSVFGSTFYSGSTIPVSGVNVSINEINYTTTSTGYYELPNVPIGLQVITATKPNYDPFSQTIDVLTGGIEFDIEVTSGIYTQNVFGIISNQVGNPIPGVNVVILNPDGSESNLATTSSSTGYYQIPAVPQGQRTVRYNRDEYDPFDIDIYISNSNYQLDIELEEISIACPGNETVVYEGQVYNTVLIGDQCWLKENLNIGSMIQGNIEMEDNGIVEKYCYDNNPSNCNIYGGLYQWDELMQYTSTPGAQGICPTGWHIPTDQEWKILEGTVDSQYGIGDPEWEGTGWRGHNAGERLKSDDGGWQLSQTNDIFGFTALPGGIRFAAGSFGHLNGQASFFTSNVGDWNRALNNIYDYEINRHYAYSGGIGISIRCIKN